MQDVFKMLRQELEREGVIYVNVKVIPKAQKTELVEMMEGVDGEQVLKVKVAAVPEKGQANTALCEYFAKQMKVSKGMVSVVQGQTSQRKVIKVSL